MTRGKRDEKRCTSLALAIVRAPVEANGGTITAENAPEGGAKFMFTLPVATNSGDSATHLADNRERRV